MKYSTPTNTGDFCKISKTDPEQILPSPPYSSASLQPMSEGCWFSSDAESEQCVVTQVHILSLCRQSLDVQSQSMLCGVPDRQRCGAVHKITGHPRMTSSVRTFHYLYNKHKY